MDVGRADSSAARWAMKVGDRQPDVMEEVRVTDFVGAAGARPREVLATPGTGVAVRPGRWLLPVSAAGLPGAGGADDAR